MLIYLQYLRAYNVQGAMPGVKVVTVNKADMIPDFMESRIIQSIRI